jgi:hypothetical protein
MKDIESTNMYIFRLLEDFKVDKFILEEWNHYETHCKVNEVCIHPFYVNESEPNKMVGVEVTFMYELYKTSFELCNIYSINLPYLKFCVENNMAIQASDYKIFKSVLTKYQNNFSTSDL